MPMIEGLGDEVTLVLGGFLFFVVVMLAWLSTHTTEIPLLRGMGVIVVELAQRANHAPPASETTGNDASANTANENTSEQVPAAAESESSGDANTGGSQNLHSSQPSPSSDARAAEKPDDTTDGATSRPEDATDGATSRPARSLPEETGSPAAAASGDSVSVDQTDSESKSTHSEQTCSNLGTEDESNPTEEQMRKMRVRYFQSLDSSEHTNVQGEGSPAVPTNPEVGDIPDNSPLSSPNSGGSDSLSSPVNDSECVTSPAGTELRHRLNPTTQETPVTERDNRDISPPTTTSAAPTTTSAAPTTPSAAPSGAPTTPSGAPTAPSGAPSAPSASTSTGSTGSTIRVKLKYMNETQRLVNANPLDTIGDFRRLGADPPENCHLTVKKLPKTGHFFQKKLPKFCFLFQKN